MDPYQLTIDYLLEFPVLQNWSELKALLTQTANQKPRHWLLPIKACQAVGEAAEKAIPAVAAIACAQISVLLIDDMLDEDPRGEYHHIGPAKAANYAAAFQATGIDALIRGKKKPGAKLSALENINQMILTLALGQHLDVQMSLEESIYWKAVEYKSASFFGTAFYLGALFGGVPDNVVRRVGQIGKLYGAMIQIHDDLNDVLEIPANPDWLQGRSPLPILFAKVVDHPERLHFIELCQSITEEGALQNAQDILVRCGAVSYCVDQLLYRYNAAQEILNTTPLHRRDVMETLLDEVVAPIWRLFDAVGVSWPTLLPTGLENVE